VSWRLYTDPLQHALIAAAVAAPLGRGPARTAVVASVAIDVDHAVAARSLRVGPMISLARRPPTHSLLAALTTGTLVGTAAGAAHGWAAFAGLASHLLHDAGDRAAPTPILWPFAPARQLGRRWQLGATAALAALSYAMARTSASPAGDGTAPPRTG
jgi:membrane-bound metal-dependent hydrolase YbcI (DUF457 family)